MEATVQANRKAQSRPAQAPAPDFNAIKAKQQATWSAGDYGVVGTTLQIVGETLCEAADLRAGERVLDVAAGNGNASLAAARRWCEVVSTDYVPELLGRGRERAAADRLAIEFRVADAENLPFDDDSFDAVLSIFGVMFAPDQERAAAELLRVCKPGGRIALASWTPESPIGELFRTIGRYVAPAPGLKTPALWGTESRIGELFGASAASIASARRHFAFRYRSAAHWIDVFRAYYGPVHKTFGALEAERQDALARELAELLERHNRAGDRSLVVPSEYLETVITKR